MAITISRDDDDGRAIVLTPFPEKYHGRFCVRVHERHTAQSLQPSRPYNCGASLLLWSNHVEGAFLHRHKELICTIDGHEPPQLQIWNCFQIGNKKSNRHKLNCSGYLLGME